MCTDEERIIEMEMALELGSCKVNHVARSWYGRVPGVICRTST